MVNYSTNTLTITILILVSVIPIVAFGFYLLDDEKNHLEHQTFDFLSEVVDTEKNRITFFFAERLDDLTVTSKMPFIQDNIHVLFEKNSVTSEDYVTSKEILRKSFQTILDIYKYETIWIVDDSFQTKLVVGGNVGETKPLDLPKFADDLKQMPQGVYLSDVYSGNFGAPSELFLSIPIFSNGNISGYIIYDIDLETFFRNTLFELSLSDTGETVLVQEQQGQIFFINQLRFDDSPPLSNSITADATLAIPAIDSSSGISGSGYSLDYRGEEIMAVWDYVPLSRWGVVVKIDTSEAFADIYQKQTDIGIIVILLTSLSFIFGYFLSRSNALPLKKLQDATVQVMKKNFDVTLNASGPAEHKTIAKNFNAMVLSLKKHELLGKQHLQELENMDVQKGEFAAMASHELKTPLVPIKGYLEMLLEDGLIGEINTKQKDTLNNIYQNTEVLERLISKILIAQRLGLGQMNWSMSEFDVFNLMETVYSDNLSLMEDKNIQFTNLTKDSMVIESDFNQLIVIFSNLIQNSVDFVNVDGKIQISAEKKTDHIIFHVGDNGIGMSPDAQKHLFKKFYQVDTSVRRKHGGTGLGLSICKGLSEGLGGKIWVESELGKGSTFYFIIPIKSQTKKT